MTPGVLSSARAGRLRAGENAALDSASRDRLMLLELATDLQNWPVRNLVFREALDRAAENLLAMAGKPEATA